jgi:uncharacterized membrane protein YeiH
MMRDALLNQDPVLLGPEIYVSAALLGALSYTLMQVYSPIGGLEVPVAIGLAFVLRASAIIFDLRLPKYGAANTED